MPSRARRCVAHGGRPGMLGPLAQCRCARPRNHSCSSIARTSSNRRLDYPGISAAGARLERLCTFLASPAAARSAVPTARRAGAFTFRGVRIPGSRAEGRGYPGTQGSGPSGDIRMIRTAVTRAQVTTAGQDFPLIEQWYRELASAVAAPPPAPAVPQLGPAPVVLQPN